MFINNVDLFTITQWWFLLFLIGILFLPTVQNVFHNFIDKGYIFAKIIGTLIISYCMFILGTTHLLPFSQTSVIFVTGIFGIINFFIYRSQQKNNNLTKQNYVLFACEELLFFVGLLFWSYIRTHQPDIHGLEKYMDFGFINSILRSDYFPPRDMWFTPFSINYYYFGHLTTAVLTKLSSIPSSITFNLMLASIFAYTFSCAFSIGINLFSNWNSRNTKQSFFQKIHFLIGGILTATLVTFAGNLHAIYLFFTPYVNEHPVPFWKLIFSFSTFPNSYWYPNATRFIYNTIHEFPLYSFVVSDLHGHVLSIPIVLTIIAFLFHEFTKVKVHISKKSILFLSFLIATAYMTNAWDAGVYLLLIIASFSFLNFRNKFSAQNVFISISFLIIFFFVFTLPFNLFFKASQIVSGIGVLCAPHFLTTIGRIGPFLFEVNHCQKSPLWQLAILYGFFYFWVILFIALMRKRNTFTKSDLFVCVLIIVSTILIIIPEFLYAKDIYPAHYRANTMFKLVYQAFIMLSISSGYIIIQVFAELKHTIVQTKRKIFPIFFVPICLSLLIIVLLYPYYAITAYYDSLKAQHTLDGTLYLQKLYPNDYSAIQWINQNIQNQPIILEAQGDSYTDFSRISTNTGLPTVLGWTVHEWLWRGTYSVPAPRITDIQSLYESLDIAQTKNLIKKYHISLVFVGNLERQKYSKLYEDKFRILGKIMFQKGLTTIYQISE